MPTSLAVTIGGVDIGGVLRFEQVAAFGLHTVATLDIKVTASSPAYVAPEWTPVTVRLGDAFDKSTWYGYVHHGGAVVDVQDVDGPVTRYTLIGTSLVMNDEKQRSWRNATASSIVRQIANEHRLRTVISPHPSVMTYYPQPGISDWKVLQDLANKTGYRLWADGSTVRFLNAKVLLRGAKVADIPVFTQSFLPSVRNDLHAFQSKVGTMVPRPNGSTARQVVSGIDIRTKTVITASSTNDLGWGSPLGSSPALTKINTGLRVSNYAQASQLVDASTTNSQGWLTATAMVTGSSLLQPGSIVDIEGQRLPQDQCGLWFVTSVTQRVLRDASTTLMPHTTILELERDQFYAPNFTRDFKINNTRDVVAATIRNGYLWESEYMENINVG